MRTVHFEPELSFRAGSTQAKSIMNKFIGSNPERDFRSAISTDLPYLPEKDSSRRGSDVVFNPRLAREFVKVQTTKKRVSIKSVKKKIVNIQGNVNNSPFYRYGLKCCMGAKWTFQRTECP